MADSSRYAVSSSAQQFHNFDFLRLIAALMVIFSHAFLIGEGTEEHEPLSWLLGEHEILGTYAVQVFFVISGFLLCASALKSCTLKSFFWKRFLRIYPGLLVCTCFTGLILSPAFSSLGFWQYHQSGLGIEYVASTLLLPGLHWNIDTVQFYPDKSQWLAQTINGTMWTIPQEMLCYALIAIITWSKLNNLRFLSRLFLVIMLIRYLPPIWNIRGVSNFAYVFPSFLAGAILYHVHVRTKFRPVLAILCCLWVLFAALCGQLGMLFPLFAAYPLIYLATSTKVRLPSVARFGDLSYGLYLYGWPAEQLARALLGRHTAWWSVWLLGTALAFVAAMLSWRFVEKPALALKDAVLRFPSFSKKPALGLGSVKTDRIGT